MMTFKSKRTPYGINQGNIYQLLILSKRQRTRVDIEEP